jgi:hypothetical protein
VTLKLQQALQLAETRRTGGYLKGGKLLEGSMGDVASTLNRRGRVGSTDACSGHRHSESSNRRRGMNTTANRLAEETVVPH